MMKLRLIPESIGSEKGNPKQDTDLISKIFSLPRNFIYNEVQNANFLKAGRKEGYSTLEKKKLALADRDTYL